MGGGDCGDELGVVGGGPGSSPGAGTDSGGGVCREAGVMQNSRGLEFSLGSQSAQSARAPGGERCAVCPPPSTPLELQTRAACGVQGFDLAAVRDTRDRHWKTHTGGSLT